MNRHEERADLLRRAFQAQRQLEHDGSSGVSASTHRDHRLPEPLKPTICWGWPSPGFSKARAVQTSRDRRAGSGYIGSPRLASPVRSSRLLCASPWRPSELPAPCARRSADPQGALPARLSEVLLNPDHVNSGIGVVNLGRIERCGSCVGLHSGSPTNLHEGSWGFVRCCPKDRQQLHLVLELPHVIDHIAKSRQTKPRQTYSRGPARNARPERFLSSRPARSGTSVSVGRRWASCVSVDFGFARNRAHSRRTVSGEVSSVAMRHCGLPT